MAGSEPQIQEADPHIMKFAIEARMLDKMVQKKKKGGQKESPTDGTT